MGVDDVELIAGDGSNIVITADNGDLGHHGFGRRVRISGTAVMWKDGTTGSELLQGTALVGTSRACERRGVAGLPGG